MVQSQAPRPVVQLPHTDSGSTDALVRYVIGVACRAVVVPVATWGVTLGVHPMIPGFFRTKSPCVKIQLPAETTRTPVLAGLDS